MDSAARDFLPLRPAFGTTGSPVTLWANYFPVEVHPLVLYHYTVKVTQAGGNGSNAPVEVTGRKLRLAMELVLIRLGNATPIATEYKQQIITKGKLSLESDTFELSLPHRLNSGTFETLTVTIHGPREVDLQGFFKFLSDQTHGPDNRTYPRFPECTSALNVILGFRARSDDQQIAEVGTSRFFPFGPNVQHERAVESLIGASNTDGSRPLEALRGFFQSIRPATGRLLLNVNVTFGVFRSPGRAVEVFNMLGISRVPKPGGDGQLLRNLQGVAKAMRGARVLVDMKLSDGPMVRCTKTVYGLASPLDIPTDREKMPRIEDGYAFGAPSNVEFFQATEEKYISVEAHYKPKLLPCRGCGVFAWPGCHDEAYAG